MHFVCFWHKADIPVAPPNVRFWGRNTENQLAVIGCLKRKGYCPIERVCVLRGALRSATEAFLAVLDAHTLADLIKPQRVLSSLLLDSLRSR